MNRRFSWWNVIRLVLWVLLVVVAAFKGSPLFAVWVGTMVGGKLLKIWEERSGVDVAPQGWGISWAVVRVVGAVVGYMVVWLITTLLAVKVPVEMFLALPTVVWVIAFHWKKLLTARVTRLLIYLALGGFTSLLWVKLFGGVWEVLNANMVILLKGVLIIGLLRLLEMVGKWIGGKLDKQQWEGEPRQERRQVQVIPPMVMGGGRGDEPQYPPIQPYNDKQRRGRENRSQLKSPSPIEYERGYGGEGEEEPGYPSYNYTDSAGLKVVRGNMDDLNYQSPEDVWDFQVGSSDVGHPMTIEFANFAEMVICTVPDPDPNSHYGDCTIQGRVKGQNPRNCMVTVRVTKIDGQQLNGFEDWQVQFGTQYDNPLNR